MRSFALASLSLVLLLTPGCALSVGSGLGAQAASVTASAFRSDDQAAADVLGYGLLSLFAGLSAVGDAMGHDTAGGPNDEAAAARLRSATIHAEDPWVRWPPP